MSAGRIYALQSSGRRLYRDAMVKAAPIHVIRVREARSLGLKLKTIRTT